MKNYFLKGFTLIETIIAIGVFSLVLTALTGFIIMGYRTFGFSWQQSIAIDEARRGIEIMVKEIREAKTGDNGSYPVVLAEDKEFVFFSDIDKDGETERVRYFLGTVSSGSQAQQCVTFSNGGACSVSFSNFFSGALTTAQVKVSLEGDLGLSNEYADILADGNNLSRLCQTGCSDCAGSWQGTTIFNVTAQAADNNIQLTADAGPQVNNICNWQEPNHSLKAKFEFSWTETLTQGISDLKKGVINPVGDPVEYPLDQEQVQVISSYLRNVPPIFRYFNAEGNEIVDLPARLRDTKIMEVYLIINVNPNQPPQDFELKSRVQLRNLKNE
ncbi:MAG: prepilin-type N-terminal cleavage/methylation domain-containing protein [bacterium]|nr:prepilin-type N-terminal cleavage/methylation domain-containing protein [bacterium]